MNEYFAHIKQDELGNWHKHDLVEHLIKVATMARNFAEEFSSGEWAFIAGLWHDLGKFSCEFQHYLKCKSNYQPDAHIETGPGRVNHSSAGALYALQKFKNQGRLFAYLIAGHHAGLPDWNSFVTGGASLSIRLEEKELLERALREEIPTEILHSTLPSFNFQISFAHLWIRMLFSCLVDADFLDTEEFMDNSRSSQRSIYPALTELKKKFDEYMAQKTVGLDSTHVNQIRRNILNQCRSKGAFSPGLFSLTVPTGGGKTLSSMAFALEHALKYNKKRIIYVIPYTSIIEQTAEIYKNIFENGVVEHHSNVDPDKESTTSRLASENWDAPIIVTTNVQFFESLFSAKSSRARKLHNLVNSVVIFDEIQQIPTHCLNPILNILQELSDRYKVTCVFATATQPALSQKDSGNRVLKGLKNVTEIIDDVKGIYESLKRVEINVPKDLNLPIDWQDLAGKLLSYRQVLCIVNSRKDCLDLYQQMPKGTIHLSALMCGEHRSNVIQNIKQLLKNGEPVRVISTQLVEAGVDIDFPVVFRALAGLDSISQAAGRCNREGKLSKGIVFVFVPPRPAPEGILRKGEKITKGLLKSNVDPLDPFSFIKYFEVLYGQLNSLDAENIEDLLVKNQKYLEIEFRTAAEKFRIINDASTSPVIVSYGSSPELIQNIQAQSINRKTLRKLQRYIVNIPKSIHNKLLSEGKIYEIPGTGIFVQSVNSLYDNDRGFIGGYEEYLGSEDFIIS